MKAQFVYENMDFERGKDPKSIIDIGLGPERMDQWENKMLSQNFSTYVFTKTDLRVILSVLRKAGILKEIFHKYHSDPDAALNYIQKEYGKISEWPSIKDYRTHSVFVDIDNIIGKNNHDPQNISLPKKIRFKKINRKVDHLLYKDFYYSYGQNLGKSNIMYLLMEAKEAEVYEEYYKKNPNILKEFKKRDLKRNRLYLPANLWSGSHGEDGSFHLEPPDFKLGKNYYLLFRPGKNWISEDKRQIAGCVNFYLEHPEIWDYKDRDKYFQDLIEKEHEIEII